MQYIELSQGMRAMVDDEDYEWLSQWKWSYFKNARRPGVGYAMRSMEGDNKKKIYMHRVITSAGLGQEVDHINGNKLDNRRCNLRIATRQENARNCPKARRVNNTSQYKGVHRVSETHGWRATIKADDGGIFLGTYQTERMAAIAYDRAALEYHGEFANLNFPDRPDDVLIRSDIPRVGTGLDAERNRPGAGWLTSKEARSVLGISKQRLSQMIQEGKLLSTSVARYVYVSALSLERRKALKDFKVAARQKAA
jgi:hypothetical protein